MLILTIAEQALKFINMIHPPPGRESEGMDKKKIRWSFLVETDAENMHALDDALLSDDGVLWEIPHSSVIGILKVEGDDGE